MTDVPPQQRKDQDTDERAAILQALELRFAPEDQVLRDAVARMDRPGTQISAWQGRLFQILALSCGARKILEIGTMTGYSAIWLARVLPEDGKLITIEANQRYAELATQSFAEAGPLAQRIELRVGPALEHLPQLVDEAPFDLFFIDADKVNNVHYLEWAIRLSRPGSLIIADNIIRNGRTFQTPPPDESSAGAAAYTRAILNHPRLVSAAALNDDLFNGIDGFSISIVR